MKGSNVSFQYIISFRFYAASNTRKIILATIICPWNVSLKCVVSMHYFILFLCCNQHKENHSCYHYLSMKWSNVSFQCIIPIRFYVASNTRNIILATIICPWNDPMCRFNTLFHFILMLQTIQGKSFLLPLFVHEMILCVVSIHYFILFLCCKQHKEDHSCYHYLSMKWSNVLFQYIISFRFYVTSNSRKIRGRTC